MQGVAFEQSLDRAFEKGYISKVDCYLEFVEQYDTEKNYVGTVGRRRPHGSEVETKVLNKVYTIGANQEVHFILSGTTAMYAEKGDQLELLSTELNGYPTVFILVKNGVSKKSPDHRITIPFRKVNEIRMRCLK